MVNSMATGAQEECKEDERNGKSIEMRLSGIGQCSLTRKTRKTINCSYSNLGLLAVLSSEGARVDGCRRAGK